MFVTLSFVTKANCDLYLANLKKKKKNHKTIKIKGISWNDNQLWI